MLDKETCLEANTTCLSTLRTATGVTAAGQRLVLDKKALTDTLNEAKIGTFRDLVDLDDAQRKEIGLKVLEKVRLKRTTWMTKKNPSIGRLRPSMR